MPDIRQLYDKDFLGQWDVTDNDLTLTIKDVLKEDVMDPMTFENKKKVCILFEETPKKLVLNVTNRDIIARPNKIKVKREGEYAALGLGYDYDNWIGKKITLYKDLRVNNPADPKNKGGIRVRGKSPVSNVKCENCTAFIEEAYGMNADDFAAYTKKKLGKCLCKKCADEVSANG